MPWIADPSSTDLQTPPMVVAVQGMKDAGELRTDFLTIHSGDLDKLFVTGTGIAAEQPTASVCYLPSSKSFKSDPNTKYHKDGTLASTAPVLNCYNAGGSDDCYWCIQ
jgi:hypothetical protein